MDTRATARKIAEEAIVLLENKEHLLPFSKGAKAALFGRAQISTVYAGNGSGTVHSPKSCTIQEACIQAGIKVEPVIKEFYDRQIAAGEKEGKQEAYEITSGEGKNSGLMYELFGKYHAPASEYGIPGEILRQAGRYTDKAILVIGRNSGGEECDRHLEGDYYLTDSEKRLVDQVCSCFPNVVLVLNINGWIDLSWTEEYKSIKSMLFAGVLGEEGAAALADILVGNVNPSGKLSVTVAKRYEDYPAAAHFSWDKEHTDNVLTYDSYGLSAAENGSAGFAKSPVTFYWEDIYAGYRYFDTFRIEPLFPFGFGRSYTRFEITFVRAEKRPDGIEIIENVANVGNMPGKETVQLYLSVQSRMNRAEQELKGFEKTELLQPGMSESVHLFVPWREWSCYDEKSAAYVIEQGKYQIRTGNSSRNTKTVIRVRVEKDIIIKQCENRIGLRPCNRGKLTFLSLQKNGREENGEKCQFTLGGEIRKEETKVSREVKADQVQKLTVEQLAALCVGYGSGLPFSAFEEDGVPGTIFDQAGRPLTTNSHPTGVRGYVSPAIVDQGIRSVFYKDGPAGIGAVAWPAEMLMACAFNRKLWYEFGNAVGEECRKRQVDIWLAPAVNLHRHPLGGRNFEFFSEDPYLTGVSACEISKGVQENHPVLVCPKHFAINEQETYRRGCEKKNYDAVDSIIQERAARELYLKPFEMLIKEAGILCLMTSFNKINGVFAGGNEELCTSILREEWGFKGFVVTDWGDMDFAVNGADAVAAGNDIIMPGGPPVIRQILEGYGKGRLTRDAMEWAVTHLVETIGKIEKRREKNIKEI